jgi:hypothetical protein
LHNLRAHNPSSPPSVRKILISALGPPHRGNRLLHVGATVAFSLEGGSSSSDMDWGFSLEGGSSSSDMDWRLLPRRW